MDMKQYNELISNELAKETVLITGATSGFGKATAILLAKHGAKLIINGRNESQLDLLKAYLVGESFDESRVHVARFDVSNKEEVRKAIAEIPYGFSDITALINNAGLALARAAAQECVIEDWESMINTNIKGMLYCTNYILSGMVGRGYGYIINLGSIAGSYPYWGGNVYGATKAFVKQFSLNLRADLLGTKIRVTNIEPGTAETNFSVVRFKGDKEAAEQVYAGWEPLQSDDIAETILWCLTRPQHVNLNRIEIMPTNQSFSSFAIHRDGS